MNVKNPIKWLQEKNPEATVYVGVVDGSTYSKFRGLESFWDKNHKESSVVINFEKKHRTSLTCLLTNNGGEKDGRT